MKRRDLLQLTLAAALARCGPRRPSDACSDAASQISVDTGVDAGASRPNVLMIVLDDLNDWVGYLGGHPQVRTPAMDALALRSNAFQRAYCAAPLCSPSRASTLSGLTPQNTGVYTNDTNFTVMNPGKLEVDQMFGRAGYTVMRTGKVDHVRADGVPLPTPSPVPFANKECAIPAGPGAFDWAPMTGPDAEMPDYVYAQRGIDFLRAQPTDRPFFLSVGLGQTHVAWYVPSRFFDLYPKASLVLPQVPASDLDDLGPEGRRVANFHDFYDCIARQNLWQDAVQAFLASISWCDEQLGRILDALEQSPHRDNTIVVVWSDHGYHLGEKFHWSKFALWEHTTRVPMLIRLPGQTSGVSIEPCTTLLDLAPTLLDRCGVQPAYAMDGRSMMPLLLDPSTRWDRPVLTSLDARNHAVRSRDFRYIRYSTGEQELYDERFDREEYRNLASDPAYAAVIAQLDAHMPPL